MESPAPRTLRQHAIDSEAFLREGMSTPASAWSNRQFVNAVVHRVKAEGYGRILPHGSAFIRPAWREAISRTLALCEADGVNPLLYARSVAETVGWFCYDKKLKLSPGHVCGPNAAKRFSKWLSGVRDKEGDGLSVLYQKDSLLEEERARVFAFADASQKDKTLAYKSDSDALTTIAVCLFCDTLKHDLADHLEYAGKCPVRNIIRLARRAVRA